MTLGEKINQANAEALKRILGAQPTLVGMGTAGEDIPGMTKKTILHAGPPVTWDKMCGPVRGAIIGGLIFGLIEQVGAQFITSTMASMLSFILFLIVLVIKPDGLLGKKK